MFLQFKKCISVAWYKRKKTLYLNIKIWPYIKQHKNRSKMKDILVVGKLKEGTFEKFK